MLILIKIQHAHEGCIEKWGEKLYSVLGMSIKWSVLVWGLSYLQELRPRQSVYFTRDRLISKVEGTSIIPTGSENLDMPPVFN